MSPTDTKVPGSMNSLKLAQGVQERCPGVGVVEILGRERLGSFAINTSMAPATLG